MGQFFSNGDKVTMITDDQLHVPAHVASTTSRTGSVALWAGRALSAFALVALGMDAGMKLLQVPEAIKGTVELGYPASAVFTLGVIQLVCWVLYVVPRTAVIGAVLWTGYFGGAVATHLRMQNPLFTHVLSGVYVAALIWGGLYLRMPQLRALLFPAKTR